MPIYCANSNSYGKNRSGNNSGCINNNQCLLNSSKKYTNNFSDIFGEYSSGNIHYQQHNGNLSALNNGGCHQSGTMPTYLYHQLPKQTNSLNNSNSNASNGTGSVNNINNNPANNNGNGANLKTSTSLIMAINRFKNSVKDMKETVLIPTRLSDLLAGSMKHEACEILSEDDHSLSTLNEESSTNDNVSYNLNNEPFKNNHIPQHQNLYEQFKLFDLIDRILSFDNILMVSLQPPSTIRTNNNGHFAMENGYHTNVNNTAGSIINDNNNNPSKKLLKYIEENNVNGLIGQNNGISSKLYFSVPENEHYHLDHSQQQKNEMTIINNGHISNNDNDNDTNDSDNDTNGKILKLNQQKQSSNSALSSNTVSNQQQPLAADAEEQRFNSSSTCSPSDLPVDDIASMDNNNDYPVSDCSLLKMYEKFKYHLLSLKSILNVMSDGAEYITQTYLDDIKSGEGRFDNSKRNNASFIESNEISSTRHYYTSN